SPTMMKVARSPRNSVSPPSRKEKVRVTPAMVSTAAVISRSSSCSDGESPAGTLDTTRTAYRAKGEPNPSSSTRSTAADSLPSTRDPTSSRCSTPAPSGTSPSAHAAHASAIRPRCATIHRGRSMLHPAVLPERTLATRRQLFVAPLVHEPPDLAHPLAVPDLRAWRTARCPRSRDAPNPACRAAQCRRAGCSRWRTARGSVPAMRAPDAVPRAGGVRDPQGVVKIGNGAHAIVRRVDEHRDAALAPVPRERLHLGDVVAHAHEAHVHARVRQVRAQHPLHAAEHRVV